MSNEIKILLVEDQTIVRQGLKMILEFEEGMRVIGEANNGREAIELTKKLSPDIILMDIQMPIMDGVEATQKIVAEFGSRIIILTTFDRDDYVYHGIRAGAMGYLLKNSPAEELIETIHKVHGGDVFIQPSIASRALKGMLNPEPTNIEPLSKREKEVLTLLAQGLKNREIGEQLHISLGTVKNHVANILGKLQAENRTQAADIARKHGLTE